MHVWKQGDRGLRRLVAFDFDNTIVAGNTDTVIRDLIKNEIPPHVQELVKTEGWTRYMEEIFRIIHTYKVKYSKEQILQKIREIPEVPGFVKLLKALKKANFDLIIISDSNSEFIREWIEYHGVSGLFTAIFTNPAHFLDDGLLIIKPYHFQTECKLSPENLCKGKILQDFIAKRELEDAISYTNVIYVGDGTNDICPVMKLKEKDFSCVKLDHGMHRVLMKNKHKLVVRSKLLYWSTGFDLISNLQLIFDDFK